MNRSIRFVRNLALILVLVTIGATFTAAQQVDPAAFKEMRWRMIGPFRGGRTRAAAGVASQPNVFYIGVCNGGVWKSDDFGRTWKPIFDDQDTGSIGAIAVAPSDPNIVYVGSGEGLQRPDLSTGDGFYKSTDAGKTWTHLGLRDGQQIPAIAVDPRDANRVFVAVLGHPYGPNEERGIYRSTDGGQNFQRVFYVDENTGGDDLAIDPKNPDVVYATMWEGREGPWENAHWGGAHGGIFKSIDGGTTWKQLKQGLPDGLMQAHIEIAASNPNRLFASTATQRALGLYRSDDAGETWTQITKDPRPAQRIGGGDLPVLRVDPKNPETVYSASVVTWKSTDGGKTWTGIRGAPGGDDYQNIWINPNNPQILLIPSDQGAIVTVNGGETWSSWYNQPSAQLYHVGTDNDFPYRVCSGQQESGSVCIKSRGNDGAINFRDWHPVGAEEYGFVTPDPLNPDIVYGGKISRYNRKTGQAQDISPKPLRGAGYRVVRTQPIVFSPKDNKTLFFAANTLWKTVDGGATWNEISGDLARKSWEMPASVGKYRAEAEQQMQPSVANATPMQRGVIYTVAPSPLDINLIWAGTDDGLIHVTRDGGKNWTNVTPPDLGAWQKVSVIDAGHFDAGTGYAAINTLRLDDLKPHILRTHDGGKSWTPIVNGIPNGETVNAVREDTVRKGLLFCSTERSVYVSFDDGDHWQSLRQNLPVSSVRDVVIKNDDLVIATHGRAFWILDDISPLRQAQASMKTTLFKPATAMRVRWNTNTDTPIPPDEPQGKNPPDGAVIDYFIANAGGAVTLEIVDSSGKSVRKWSSDDKPEPPDPTLAIPQYWVRPPRVLPAEAGMHRWIWDLHWQPVPGGRANYAMQAIAHDTPASATGPWVLPGQYTLKLTADGQTFTQPITVKMDPRVMTPAAALNEQFTLSHKLYDQVLAIETSLDEARAMRQQGGASESVDAIAGREPQGFGGGGGRFGGGGGPETLSSLRGTLSALLGELQRADVAPTSQLKAAVSEKSAAADALLAKWRQFRSGAK